MTKMSMRTLNHTLSKVMKLVERGEEIIVTHRNRIVARILPPSHEDMPDVDWKGFLKRMESHRKKYKLKGAPLSQTISEDREE